MRVTQIWRYPIKSLAGEQLDRATVGPLGIAGDRAAGLIDADTGLTLTARRVPELLFATATVGPDGAPAVRLPDGRVTADAGELSAWLGRPVRVHTAGAGARGRFEFAVDDDRADGDWVEWDSPAGVFHDLESARVSIVGAATLGEWDVRRFRTNVVVADLDERELVGCRLRIGTVVLDVTGEIDRCVMVTRPQPGLDRDRDVLRRISAERAGKLSVGAVVVTTGEFGVGDRLEVVGTHDDGV